VIRPSQPGPTGDIGIDTTDVIVIGGGPVGLAMALDLGTRGVNVLLVDRSDGVISYPTAESIDVRTMEWIRSVGCADALDQSGFPVNYPRDIAFVTTMRGRELVRFRRPSNAERLSTTAGLSCEAPVWWPKFWFDTALRDRAAELRPVLLRYRWTCSAVTQSGDGVHVDLLGPAGEKRVVRAQFVVACDGGQSTIRKSAGIRMVGSVREARWQGAMVQIDGFLAATRFAPSVQYYVLAPRRLIFGSLDGGSFWRVTYPLSDHETPTIEDVTRTVRDALGGLDLPIVVHDMRPWSGHSVVAEAFRDRRVVLAGDAAHQMWPSGGHGMNTGIGDVANLGWKLALAVRGLAGPGLLDSYERERRPVAERNVRRAASNYAADIGLPNGPGLIGEGPVAEAARLDAMRAIRDTRATEWSSMGVQLGYRYTDSPIVVAPGGSVPPDDPSTYLPVVCGGHRAPHTDVDGLPLIDVLGSEFTLLRTQQDLPVDNWISAFAARRVGLKVVTLPRAGAYEQVPLSLVRPDGVIAWAGASGADADHIVQTALGFQAAHTQTQAEPTLGAVPTGMQQC